jgi:hypothetical protein
VSLFKILPFGQDLRSETDLMLRSPKKELPNDMGFLAYFTDTEKNVLGVWSMK